MANIHDAGSNLEKAIRDSAEYRDLKTSFNEVNKDPQAKRMFESFRNLQMSLQQKQMTGQQITPAEADQAQRQVQVIQQNQAVAKLLANEQRMSNLIMELNKIITKPLEELYGLPNGF